MRGEEDDAGALDWGTARGAGERGGIYTMKAAPLGDENRPRLVVTSRYGDQNEPDRQALVFALLIVLGLLAWGMGTAPMGTAPFLGGSPEDSPIDFGFPFYLGTNLHVLFAVSAGFFFPRCFYLWGAALLTLYPFADVAHFLWLELVAGFDVVRGGAYGWLGVATVATVFAIINASIATVLAAVGVCLRLGVHRLKTGEW